MAFFAKITCLDISEQELRRAIEGISSPSPQPEDPERALDPGLEEDPDTTVEFVNGIGRAMTAPQWLLLLIIPDRYPRRV